MVMPGVLGALTVMQAFLKYIATIIEIRGAGGKGTTILWPLGLHPDVQIILAMSMAKISRKPWSSGLSFDHDNGRNICIQSCLKFYQFNSTTSKMKR